MNVKNQKSVYGLYTTNRHRQNCLAFLSASEIPDAEHNKKRITSQIGNYPIHQR